MKTSEFKQYLEEYPHHQLRFVLPDDDVIPAHVHITEAGRIDKIFVDCGGTVRKVSNVTLQAWVADDVGHRLLPGKLAGILGVAAPIFASDDLDVEIEYEDCSISQFPVLAASVEHEALTFRLGSKHTDCLAKDICLPQSSGGCGPGCC
jgi:hypothetical protein